uniref:Integrase catalytic domain-containing protein n=1 Tax=Phytophthora ramorum TaxID=164328 RepID=H3GKF0_PHYRM
MERMLETVKTTITPAQAMKLFTAPKEPQANLARALHVLGGHLGGLRWYLVLNNVVPYASADLRTVLIAKVDGTRVDYLQQAEELAHFAQSWELEARTKNIGKEVVGAVAEHRGKETRRHLVNDESWLGDVELCKDSCIQPSGALLHITKKGSLTLRVSAYGDEMTIKLTEVYFVMNVKHNLISYGMLDKKDYGLTELNGRRVMATRDGGSVAFDVGLEKNVLVVRASFVNQDETPAEVIMAVLEGEASVSNETSGDVQKETLVEFHKRFGHLNYDAVERFDCKIHVLRTDFGGEYQNADRFCKRTGVQRQRSDARNQASNGKAERLHRTIMNMARCMVFTCGLPLSFWGDAVQYAAYILNGSPTNSNPGRMSPMKLLTKQTPQLGEIAVFGSPCTNGQVQRLYLDESDPEEEETPEGNSEAATAERASNATGTSRPKKCNKSVKKTKKTWTRERPVTRSVGRRGQANADERLQQEEPAGNVPTQDGAMVVDLRALEQNGVWEVVKMPRGVRVLHTKWVFKAKLDEGGLLERLKARLVAHGNEQEFGVNYSITFAAVVDMTSVILILVLMGGGVPAKQGDVPNAYVKAEKEANLAIFIHLLQGMVISEEMRKALGVERDDEIAQELEKALYGLKQAGRLWNKLLHKKLVTIGFVQCLTDIFVYFRWSEVVLLVVGVYVDDLLVTGTEQLPVDAIFEELREFSVKDLGRAIKFLGMCVTYDEVDGYELDQEVTIMEIVRNFGMELAHGVRAPIGPEWNEARDAEGEKLPVAGSDDVVTAKKFQSLVGSIMWIARCTRPDIAFAVHKTSRRTHNPTMNDWKLATRVLRYLGGTKELRLQMRGDQKADELLKVAGYSDADFAANREDRKSVTGGLVTVDGRLISWMCK